MHPAPVSVAREMRDARLFLLPPGTREFQAPTPAIRAAGAILLPGAHSGQRPSSCMYRRFAGYPGYAGPIPSASCAGRLDCAGEPPAPRCPPRPHCHPGIELGRARASDPPSPPTSCAPTPRTLPSQSPSVAPPPPGCGGRRASTTPLVVRRASPYSSRPAVPMGPVHFEPRCAPAPPAPACPARRRPAARGPVAHLPTRSHPTPVAPSPPPVAPLPDRWPEPPFPISRSAPGVPQSAPSPAKPSH